MTSTASPRRARTVLGFPVEDFTLLQSMLLTLASTLVAFFGCTAAAIFALLAWNGLGHHAVNYADSYLYVGLPAAILAFAITAPLFTVLWLRAKMRE